MSQQILGLNDLLVLQSLEFIKFDLINLSFLNDPNTQSDVCAVCVMIITSLVLNL